MKPVRIVSALLLLAVLLFSGCQIAGSVSDENRDALEGVFLQTHLGEVESDQPSSRAAVPWADISEGIGIPTVSTVQVSNYPEKDQVTSYTIASTSTSGVYKVTVGTTYPDYSVRATATEVYYILDNAPTGTYGVEDQVLAADLSTVDSRYRETMETSYVSSFGGSDTVRYETIADDINHSLAKLDSLSGGSMVYGTVSGSALAENAAALWSSKVTYTQSAEGTANVVAAILGFSLSATYTTTGTRYYTELPVTSGAYDRQSSSLWFEETKADGKLVAQTVTREYYYFSSSSGDRSLKTVRTRTILYDSDGKKNLQLEKEGYDASSMSFY